MVLDLEIKIPVPDQSPDGNTESFAVVFVRISLYLLIDV